ncbi:MAG: thioredoxin family protein [Proteobacteria bacterium]|nr:thioredoxin family protein [Pseudomonadota bacterium]
MRYLIAALLLMLAGCDNANESGEQTAVPAPVDPQKATHAGIAWYEGSIEQAFAESRASGSPVFLYWGAVWCPPCQEIKHTVFKSQEFINLTRLFIPVYLDGDTERAQSWGEKFGVMGYPTMIVFNPEGQEVTRIPGGIDISRYNSVLELSLNQMRPTSTLVGYALGDIDRLTADDYYQLAYYSWGQDTAAVPGGTDKADLFYRLSTGAMAYPELSARFFMHYLVALATGENGDEAGLEPADGDEVAARLTALLSSDELTLACWDTLAYYPDDILEMAIFSEDQRAELEGLWSEQLFSLRFDPSLSRAEKLAGWLPLIYVNTRDDQPLSDDLVARLRDEMQQVDADTPDSFERQSVINQMSYVYRNAGLREDARSLLLAELGKSASPYYFMSGLASMSEKDEQFDEAVEWRRKAYESATGEATRFQWGANYVRAMIRMVPLQTETISAASLSLLDEFHASHEMFAGRNFKILRRLAKQLDEWQETHDVTGSGFKSRIESLCSTQAEGSLEQQNCLSLSAPEVVAEAG